jgi:hypothetical protein
MQNKILYFGTGTYLEPILHFSDTNEFILGDSLPRNSHGFDYYSRTFYNKYFILQLEDKISKMNFKLISKKILTNKYEEINVPNIESECLFLTTANCKIPKNIKYYTSTSLPFDLYDNILLQTDIETCDSLLICGYKPHIKIIKYIKKPFNLIGYSNTYFPKDIQEIIDENKNYKDDINYWIINNPHFIKSYIAVDRETGEKYFYKNYSQFYEKLNLIKNDLKI